MLYKHTFLFTQEYKNQAVDYFVAIQGSSSDDGCIQAMLMGLQGLVSLFGPDLVRPHTKLIQRLRKEGATVGTKDMAGNLLDALEGRRYKS